MITQRDIEAGYKNPDWQGHGYLGARRHLRRDDQRESDAFAIIEANRRHWSKQTFFGWLNSSSGRHFADYGTAASRIHFREWVDSAQGSAYRDAATAHNAEPLDVSGYFDGEWEATTRVHHERPRRITPSQWGMSRQRQQRPAWCGRTR